MFKIFDPMRFYSLGRKNRIHEGSTVYDLLTLLNITVLTNNESTVNFLYFQSISHTILPELMV